MFKKNVLSLSISLLLSMGLFACVDDGETGPQGPAGQQGPAGEQGPVGPQGPAGQDGQNGQDGQKGQDATAYVHVGPFFEDNDQILTDPMLTGPAPGSISVVWYSAMPGNEHRVVYGEGLTLSVTAVTTEMSQMFEDANSDVAGRFIGEPAPGEAVVKQRIFRHEARVEGLTANQRVPYYAVTSVNGVDFKSQVFTLQPLPSADQPVRLLITSDQQNRAMSPANFEKVVETVGKVDAVLFAGDLVDTPNRASEWFYRSTDARPPFFPAIQGTYDRIKPDAPHKGGAILQHAPLLGTIGNHESPGFFDPTQSLNFQDNNAHPRWYAAWKWSQLTEAERAETGLTEEEFVRRNSYDHVTYYEMWNHPENGVEGEDPENYYSLRFGNVSLISMNVSRIWRNWNDGFSGRSRGKFSEPPQTINDIDTWGFGDMFFADYSEGSAQRNWLASQLQSNAFTSAPYKVVLTHQSMHGYGDNSVPVMANPEATITFTDGRAPIVTTFPAEETVWAQIVAAANEGVIERVRYKYEREKDLWLGVEQELLEAGADLVVSGHSHVWTRTFVASQEGARLNYLESSNVGNSFGPFASVTNRVPWARNFYPDPATNDTVDPTFWTPEDYPRVGDPHNRPDVVPSEVNNGVDFMRMVEGATEDLPFLSSNQFTVFTILDSGEGTVRSYAHHVAFPQSPAVMVDCFPLDSTATTNPCEAN